ncbi:MAG: SAM-dependent methyltransferase [Planctomycetota bacterium]
MERKSASWTAEVVAAFRAAETIRENDRAVCRDEFAKHFLRPAFRFLTRWRWLSRLALWLAVERKFPGTVGNIVLRVRYFDDCVEKRLQEGIGQVVILGAGYDTRAYRIPEFSEGVRVFEVDHPRTLEDKMEKVRSVFQELPRHVDYVATDFLEGDLARKLGEAGYSETEPTLFLMEGVTMYLSAAAMDDTLAFVRDRSGENSSILFDYARASVLDGTHPSKELARAFLETHRKKGEPFTFGIPRAEVETFMARRGFGRVEHVESETLRARYFGQGNEDRSILPFYGFVHSYTGD